MKIQKWMTALAAVVLSVTLLTGSWAKPGKGNTKNDNSSNHGKTVSRAARDKSDSDYKNHGQKVSRVARKNSNRIANGTRRYRTVRRYNSKTRRYENVRRWSRYDSNTRTWRRE